MSATAKLAGLGRNAQGIATAAILLAAFGLAVYAWRKGPGGIAGDAGKAAGQALGGAAVGVVKGIGEGVGIEDTNSDACDQALAEGRWWDASFACPAKKFISSVFGGSGSASAPADSTTKLLNDAASNPGLEIGG